jgi:glutamine synthetase
MLQRWVKRKRSEERLVRDRPHPYEIELYYDL